VSRLLVLGSFNMHGLRWFYCWQHEVRPPLGPAYGIQ
jgi:hypothetical protein